MKKILLIVITVLFSISLYSCGPKEEDAVVSIKLGDELQDYLISPTTDKRKIEEVLNTINVYAPVPSFDYNGLGFDFKLQVEGDLLVKNTKETKVNLKYDISSALNINIKKFISSGTLLVDGFTNTDSIDLQIKSKYKIDTNVTNDMEYLYLDGLFDLGNNSISAKNKIGIKDLVQEYQSSLAFYFEFLKYRKLTSLIDDIEAFIDEYNVSIDKTTKDTITLGLEIPLNSYIESSDSSLKLKINLTISCQSLLPVMIDFQADELLGSILEDKYLEKYTNSSVEVNSSSLSFVLKIEYGKYNIEELADIDKLSYNLIDIGTYF